MNVSVIRSFSILSLLAALPVLFSAENLAAQTPVPLDNVVTPDGQAVQADGVEMLREAYARTKTAVTVEEFTEILELCDRAQEAGIPEERVEYRKKLRAWLLNKRGQACSDLAMEKAAQGGTEEAAALEEKAITDYSEAIQLDPQMWRAYHNRGVSLAGAGLYDEALADFTKTLEMNPKYANTWFNRGEIQYDRGDFAAAATDYREAIALNPVDPEFHACLGHALFQMGKYEEAVEQYGKVVTLLPDNPGPYLDRGDAYCCLRQWESAAKDYREALRVGKDCSKAYMNAAWLMATCPDERFRNNELVLETALKAVELDGEPNFHNQNVLAVAYAAVGQFDKAVETVDKAIELAPDERKEELVSRREWFRQGKPFVEQIELESVAESPEPAEPTETAVAEKPKKPAASPKQVPKRR